MNWRVIDLYCENHMEAHKCTPWGNEKVCNVKAGGTVPLVALRLSDKANICATVFKCFIQWWEISSGTQPQVLPLTRCV